MRAEENRYSDLLFQICYRFISVDSVFFLVSSGEVYSDIDYANLYHDNVGNWYSIFVNPFRLIIQQNAITAHLELGIPKIWEFLPMSEEQQKNHSDQRFNITDCWIHINLRF